MPRLATLKPRVAFARQRIVSHHVDRIRGRANQRRRERILSAQPLCVLCQAEDRVALATEVDHVVPLWKGGGDHDGNLQPLCSSCHASKSAREAAERGGGAT
ncbi:MAG: HNH endonuclease [Burkholderiales bacterium]|nr:HNH endonuclease [Burkholderiales bacterium]MBP6776217.1 HNH endonuclease [Piscinibacter sp.]